MAGHLLRIAYRILRDGTIYDPKQPWLDAIDAPTLRRWREREITEARRAPKSGRECLDVIEMLLRHGEPSGLRWGYIAFGDGSEDPTRHVFLQRVLSSGLEPGLLKPGRARRVPLARRLAEALLDVRRARFDPSPDSLVIQTGYFEPERGVVRPA